MLGAHVSPSKQAVVLLLSSTRAPNQYCKVFASFFRYRTGVQGWSGNVGGESERGKARAEKGSSHVTHRQVEAEKSRETMSARSRSSKARVTMLNLNDSTNFRRCRIAELLKFSLTTLRVSEEGDDENTFYD